MRSVTYSGGDYLMALNLFDLLNEARRLTELSGAVLQKSKRYPQRYAL
ncbi:hypothetical protein HAZ15_005096, partial [Salmonella enterica]|nr:hypothetical protein [Salmonella enterica]